MRRFRRLKCAERRLLFDVDGWALVPTPPGLDANGSAHPTAFDYFLELPLTGFRSGTPGPSPFKSMNSNLAERSQKVQ